MVRIVAVVAVLAVAFIALKDRIPSASGGAATAPVVNTTGVPSEFRAILADRPDPAAILRSRGALPGLGVISRLAHGGGSDADTPEQPAPFADVGTPAELRAVRADIRRDLAVLNRLTDGDVGAAERALADVYSAPVLRALGPSGRREFAERVAGRTQAAQRIKVLDFQGIFVSGRRALAQVVYRLSMRAPSGRYIARSPQTWTVTLAREGDHWRFVRGFET
jgi:hypothetical protein